MKKALAVFVIMAVLAAFADNPHITQLIELVDVAIVSPIDGDVLTFDAASLKWTNKQPPTSQGPQGPQGIQGPQGPEGPQGIQGPQGNPVVARFEVVDSTTDLPQTVIFTPIEPGMYRLNVYQETQPRVPIDSTAPCPHISYSWTDDYFSPSGVSTSMACGSGTRSPGVGGAGVGLSNLMRTPGPISFSVTNPGGITFSLYITIEKL